MLGLRSTLALVLGAVVLSAAPAAAAVGPVAPTPVDVPGPPALASVLGEGGAWCWFSDTRAVHHRGVTYTAWIDITGRIYVSSLERATQRLRTVAVATRFNPDDHNNPSLLIHTSGLISVFWSGHNGTAIHVRTTARPLDLTSFGPRRDVTSKVPGDTYVTYTNPVQVPSENGRLYLFWRSHYTHQAYATSDDDGRTWSPARVLFEQPDQRPYVKYDHRGGTIAAALTDGHPSTTRTSVYYVAFRNGVAYRADGTRIGRMDAGLRPSQGDVLWEAVTSGRRAWVWDTALDAGGRPVVVFSTFASTRDHRYHYARWDGGRWQVSELTAAGGSISEDDREPYYSGGIALDHGNPDVVVLSRPGRSGVHEIERWQRFPDHWTRRAVTQNSQVHQVRPVVTRGLSADQPSGLSWMSGDYRYYTRYRTSILTTGLVPASRDLPTSARISQSHTRVRAGTSVTIRARLVDGSGRGLGRQEVTLLMRPNGATTWHRVLERRTDDTGLVAFQPRVSGSVQYAVEWPGDNTHRRSITPAATVYRYS